LAPWVAVAVAADDKLIKRLFVHSNCINHARVIFRARRVHSKPDFQGFNRIEIPSGLKIGF
jgi:hypothetical protein